MNNSLTHIAFILDRNGAMDSIAKEAMSYSSAHISERRRSQSTPN